MQDIKIVSKYIKPDEDFLEGEQWVATLQNVRTEDLPLENGEYVGYGTEIQDEDGNVKKVKFVYEFEVDGQDKILTQSSPGIYRQIRQKGINEGDSVAIVRVGQKKERRLTIIKK